MLKETIIRKEIIDYIEEYIIPKYKYFDEAHREDHVEIVINQSLEIANDLYEIDSEMVYIIAAYHDLGIEFDRKQHHLISAQLLRNDKMIKTWYASDDINLMADAIEDHRASGNIPRTVYGKIVSDADRVYDFDIIIKRCILYRKSLSLERCFQDTRDHIIEKYSSKGYLKNFYFRNKDIKTQNKLERFSTEVDYAMKEFVKIYNKTFRKDE